MSIICSGSVAFDRLLSHGDIFSKSIIADKIDMLNVCFLVDTVKRTYGGTAGNIAYSLALLGEKPILASSLGDDPDGLDYLDRIKSWNISLDGLNIAKGCSTAGCTLVTDVKNNQLIFFHPGAMNVRSAFDPSALPGKADDHLAIVSPGGTEEMKSLCAQYRQLGIKFVFDPGQQVPAFSGEDLREMIDGAHIFICNAYEFELFKKLSGLSLDEIFLHVETVIVTQGEKGSDLLVQGRGSQRIMAAPVSRVGNPTGVGDAYRAGLLKALAQGETVLTACRLGTIMAAFCLEADGTQNHKCSPTEVMARYATCFHDQIRLI